MLVCLPLLALAMSGAPAQEASPPTDGAGLWQYLNSTSPYWKWDMWPGKGKFYPGTAPHGALLTTYVNKAAYDGIKARTGVLPYGSIIVKENYKPDKKPAAVTVMYKVKGYNPDGGDWFWVKYDPHGVVLAQGKVPMCISCHDKRNDYVMTAPLK